MKRMRNRHHRSGGGGGTSRGNNGQIPLNRNHVFESNGPDLRIRGTAQQLFEKYLQLGRDATGTGDRVQAEAYFQHAEHYFRVLNAMNQAAQAAQQERAERQRHYEQVRQERRETREQQNEGEEPAAAPPVRERRPATRRKRAVEAGSDNEQDSEE